MTALTLPPPVVPQTSYTLRRFSVAEYHRMIAAGILTENDRVELLEGLLVCKMSRNPPHDSVLDGLTELLRNLLPSGWRVRTQSAITLADSEPEPDFAVVPGSAATYRQHHPGAAEVTLVGEVADSTLVSDRQDKGRIYARAGLPQYWIVNIAAAVVEVYSEPSGPEVAPHYRQRQDYGVGDAIPVLLRGTEVGRLRVAELQL